MNRLRFLAALGMTMLLTTTATKAQQVINVRGIAIDSATQKPLFKTTVIRLSDNAVFFTDSAGQFDINVTRNDAVRFSFVGYKTLRLVIANAPDSALGYKKFLRIAMPVDKHALQQIVVKGEKPQQQDCIFYAKALKPLEVENALQSPISALYAEFSKREKEKRQLREILQDKYLDDLYRYRMPKSLLYMLTGDRTFTPEMLQRRCPLSEFYLTSASDYELYNYARECYRRYKSGY